MSLSQIHESSHRDCELSENTSSSGEALKLAGHLAEIRPTGDMSDSCTRVLVDVPQVKEIKSMFPCRSVAKNLNQPLSQ
jgi:hypothetical protein